MGSWHSHQVRIHLGVLALSEMVIHLQPLALFPSRNSFSFLDTIENSDSFHFSDTFEDVDSLDRRGTLCFHDSCICVRLSELSLYLSQIGAKQKNFRFNAGQSTLDLLKTLFRILNHASKVLLLSPQTT